MIGTPRERVRYLCIICVCGGVRSLSRAMGDGLLWEPSTKEEVEYYNKLFRVVDRDNSGTLDGKEVVLFLKHSGLTQDQLKDVWSVANSPGQKTLQRQEFYVAMRAVALAQNGETTLTRRRVRETAIDPIAMATFTGMPAPPIMCSEGKNLPPSKTKAATQEPPDAVAGKKGSAATPAGPKKAAKTGVAVVAAEKRKCVGASFGKNGTGGKTEEKASETTRRGGVATGPTKTTAKASAKEAKISIDESNDGSSSSFSETTSKSENDDEGSSRRGSEKTDEIGEGRGSGMNTAANSDIDDNESSESSHGSSHSEPSAKGKECRRKILRQSGGMNRGGSSGSDNEEGIDSDRFSTLSSGSGPSSNTDAGSARSDNYDHEDDDDDRPTSIASDDEKGSGSSSSSSASSSSSENEGPDPFAMSEKARARYQAIFSKVDATGMGFLGGKQVIGLLTKSGLDKSVLATIWRLSDLDEDGSLSAQEFRIAFHLIFCATQRKLEVPDELPASLWPTGYVPPSVLARREAEAQSKRREEEQEQRQNEEAFAAKIGEGTSGAPAMCTTTKKQEKEKQRKKKTKSMAGGGEKGKKATGGPSSTYHTKEDDEEEGRREQAAREAASLQKKEELAKRAAEKAAKNKNKKTRVGNKALLAAAAAAEAAAAAAAAEAKSPRPGQVDQAAALTTAPAINAELATANSPNEGAPSKDAAAAAAAAATSSRSAASDALSSVDGGDVVERDESGAATKMKKKKRRRQQPPASDVPPSVAEGSDGGGGGGRRTSAPEIAAVVRPLTMAERRSRKAAARAARVEAALLKKEAAARDARMEELDLQGSSKTFIVKAMQRMEIAGDRGSIHMLADTEVGGGDVGPLSFARLSAPLPHLTPHPGRAPCLQPQEFSVSFPSGIRRASSLTPSLDIRLGPPPAPLAPSVATDGGGGDSDKGDGVVIDGVGCGGLMRCPQCAESLPRAQIMRHIRSTCRLLPCALCSRLLLPADRERHLEEECPNRRRCCTRCGVAVVLSEFARHETEGGCVSRAVPCTACGAFCSADELSGHEANECPERRTRCPSCGDVVPARSVPEHASLLCRSIPWACRCGAGPLPLVDRPRHLETCDAFKDAWEASIEKVFARLHKIEVIRNIGKVMILTRVENPAIALLALAESGGNASLAARRAAASRLYLDEISLAAEVVNVEVFLRALRKPGKRGSGALWRTGL